ncbi:DUF1801 domain-containing protein [Cryobacterium breve]|uniref:DUF1801 domain-containing protein n=1 Tax=Cryobacterium breve TaxID=1259258 RepID=A0ABY7NGK5_9MICO|nr:DUF1801 domain-containing protein [Cryobacterium breve]
MSDSDSDPKSHAQASADRDTDSAAAAAAVRAFIDAVPNPTRRRDAETLLELMSRITGEKPRMWFRSIVGYGQYHYQYASGREGDACAAGFSPRKAATTIYLANGVGAYTEQLERLGSHTTGVGCLYLKDLATVDLAALEAIIADSYRVVTSGTYGHRAHESATEPAHESATESANEPAHKSAHESARESPA